MFSNPIISPIVAGIKNPFGIGGGGVAPAAPLPQFDYLVVLGSSTTHQAFVLNPILGRQEQSARLSMTQAGYDVPIISKAVEGATIANLDTNINTYLASLGPISAADPSRVAVVVNIGSNDIGTTSYAAMAQGTKDAMVAGVNSIISKIEAFGFTPILATVHSRPTFELMYEGWADLMYRPLVDSRTPFWKAGALAVFDYCRLYLENKDVPNWWNPDNTHPWMATVPMQQYTAQKLGSKAQLPPVSEQDRVLFHFPISTTHIGGFNSINAAASANLAAVFDSKGALLPGASFGWTGAGGASGGVRPNPGAWGVDLSNNAVQSGTLIAVSGLIVTFTAAFGAPYALRTGTLRATASSTSANRLTRVTVGAESGVLNASGPGVQIVEIPFAMNGDGTLVFTAQAEGASTYANMSGVELVFDPA